MAFNSSTKKVCNSGLIKVVETKVNCNYSTENDVVIDKILDGFAYASVDQSERVGETLQVAGKVNFTGVYLDVEKQVHSAIIQADFSDKIQTIEADAIAVCPKIKAIKQKKETSVFVEATIIIELEVYGVIQETLCYTEPNNENFAQKTKEVKTQSLLCFNNTNFEQAEEFEINDEVVALIATYSSLSVNKINANGNYALVEGELVRDVVYVVNGGIIKKYQKRTDISEEVSLLNCTTETNCSAKCYVSDSKADITIAEDGKKATVSASSVINISLWGYETSEFTVVEDLFSTTLELVPSVSSFISYNYLPVNVSTDHLNITADVSDRKRIDEVVCVGSSFVKVETCTVNDGFVQVNGTISQTIMGKNYDNDDVFSSVVEMPFATQVNLGVMCNNSEVDCVAYVRCTNCKNKAGKELALSFDLCVIANAKTYNTEVYVSDVSEIGLKPAGESSIIVYMPDNNEQIFDIAKKLNVTPDCLLAQNPGIEDGKQIEKVVVYKRHCI